MLRHLFYMRRNLFFSLFLIFGLGLAVSSCAPGVYAGVNVGSPYPYYGGGYGYGYGGGYYGRPLIVTPPPRPYFRGGGGWHGGDSGYHGGGGYRGGGGYHGGGGGFRGGSRRGR